MIQGITAQGKLVGQNLMYSIYTFENPHKDWLQELKKKGE
jgi:hypothetical protein